MNSMSITDKLAKIRLVLVLGLIGLTSNTFAGDTSNQDEIIDSLKSNFKNPSKEYSILPFWSWNGTLTADKLISQMDAMMEKGIDGAFFHARAGLDESETPYFSKGFWDAVDTTISYGAANNFDTYLYDEDKWPSGSAGGRTIAANPEEFSKKALYYSKMVIVGPQTIKINQQDNPLAVFAAPISIKGAYDVSAQVNLTDKINSTWDVPAGRWAISSFKMQKDPHEHIDYLDSAAVAKFIEITHEEYFSRYGEHFGKSIPGIFFDEIYANPTKKDDNIFWTDDFLEQFSRIKGYDLTEHLPLILFDEKETATQVRYDYFDVVEQLYSKAWFKQYADWCDEHDIWVTGHTTEMLGHYERQSDYFSTMSYLQVPGTDNEEYRYSFPRRIDWYNNKQVSSVANLNKRERIMAEAMGGGGYTISLDEYRYGFSMLGVYGINMFVPHLFHYSMDTPESQSDWPPSWFFRNAYWKYFKPLADVGSRISYLNSQGTEVCDVVILYPLTDLWSSGYKGKDDTFYKEVQQLLMDEHINYNIIDPASLTKATVENASIVAGNGNYKVLVLPDITTVRVEVIAQIEKFVNSGGTVISLKSLPYMSGSGLQGDGIVSQTVDNLFGMNPEIAKRADYYAWNKDKSEHFTSKETANGGVAIFTHSLSKLPQLIEAKVETDLAVHSHNAEYFRFNHRLVNNSNIYFFVNDHSADEKYHVSLKDVGTPSIWNAETGEVTPVENYIVNKGRLEMVLDFEPMESYFLVLDDHINDERRALVNASNLVDTKTSLSKKGLELIGWSAPNQKNAVEVSVDGQSYEKQWNSTNDINTIELVNNWEFQLTPNALRSEWTASVDLDTFALPIMKFRAEKSLDEGVANKWFASDMDDASWSQIKVEDNYNTEEGIQRYYCGWDAKWISYYDHTKHLNKIAGGEHFFTKEYVLNDAVSKAQIAITADQEYELWVNSELVGKDEHWEVAELYDIAKYLKKGVNNIEVKTLNTAGLLVQGMVESVSGQVMALLSDDSWSVADKTKRWQTAFEFALPGSGKWGHIENPLHKVSFPHSVWYRQQLAPGVIAIKKPLVKGEYTIYVNGKELSVKEDESFYNIESLLNTDNNFVSLKVVTQDYSSGLISPIEMVCGKVNTPLVAWDDMGINWYSGHAIYTKSVEVTQDYLDDETKLILDLGEVKHFAEVWVNGELVKSFSWGPYDVDISEFVRSGTNDISIVVANMQVNKANWNILDANINDQSARWWHDGSIMREKETLKSGLFGPVTITPLTKERVKIKL